VKPGGASIVTRLTIALILGCSGMTLMAEDFLVIDDRRSGDYRSSLGSAWRLISDGVMGGVSEGRLTLDRIDGRDCLRLRGDVRVENRGGFLQAALDMNGSGNGFDAADYRGVLLDVYGNDETYNVHLRSSNVWLPWQAYRASFQSAPGWHTVRLDFSCFQPYRIGSPLNPKKLERLGVVAIGRAFSADLCVARVALYK
jgi:hypothetical protein